MIFQERGKKICIRGITLILICLIILCFAEYSKIYTIIEFLPQPPPNYEEVFKTIPGVSTYKWELENTKKLEHIYSTLCKTKVKKKSVSESYLTQYLRYSVRLYYDDGEIYDIVYYPDVNFIAVYHNLDRVIVARVMDENLQQIFSNST